MEGQGYFADSELRIKGAIQLYQITQDESFKLRKMFPNIAIKVCSRRKKGRGSKTYWCEEGKRIQEAIDKLREGEA
jgi:hypothetical protein